MFSWVGWAGALALQGWMVVKQSFLALVTPPVQGFYMNAGWNQDWREGAGKGALYRLIFAIA